MKNRSVAIGQRTLPYTKAYRQIAGSVTATILFGRLEYWFDRYPDGFYKFLDPSPSHVRYTKGDSWTEELEYSIDEFRTAFDCMGIRYPHYDAYKAAENLYLKAPKERDGQAGIEMLYCSYYDRVEGLTFYYRNHELVDRKLDELNLRPSRQRPHGQKGFPQGDHLGNAEMTILASPRCPSRHVRDDHVGNAEMLPFSINTHETNTHKTTTTPRARGRGVVEEVSVYKYEQFLAYALSPAGKGIHTPQLWALDAAKTHRFDPVLKAWLASQPQRTTAPLLPPLPGNPAPEIREGFLSAISEQVSQDSFRIYFYAIKDVSRDGDTIYFRVPEASHPSWINDVYDEAVRTALKAIGLDECASVFTI